MRFSFQFRISRSQLHGIFVSNIIVQWLIFGLKVGY